MSKREWRRVMSDSKWQHLPVEQIHESDIYDHASELRLVITQRNIEIKQLRAQLDEALNLLQNIHALTKYQGGPPAFTIC